MSGRIVEPARLSGRLAPSAIGAPSRVVPLIVPPAVAGPAELEQHRRPAERTDRRHNGPPRAGVVADAAALVVEDQLRFGLLCNLTAQLLLQRTRLIPCQKVHLGRSLDRK